jgi:hypothetical protein
MAPRLRSYGVGAFVAAVVFVLGYGFDLLVLRDPKWILADTLALAVVVGLLVSGYEHRRASWVAEQIRIIRDMNCYIRNELQVIVSVTPENGSRALTITDCVDHIDWALRELLPGKAHLGDENSVQEVGKLDRSA